MVFSSLFFLYAFLPASLIAYVLCPTMKAKNISLLACSLVFYAWGEPKYVLLLAAMALFDWFFALQIDKTPQSNTRMRKLWVALACVVDLGLIGWFKYSGMIASVFGEPPAFIANIALPIGISFYTFQLLTYVVDVYRGEAKAQKQYWHVLLYAALFHQCIAGPIVRYQTIADELFESRDPYRDMPSGVMRFATGLAKKVLLANTCGALADTMLLTDAAIADAAAFTANLQSLSGTSVLGLWLGILAYTLQIYLDFSAYSDMAIGMGRMLGLHYLENFDYPYVSRSVTEFWRRWHMSLGTFFRDYVYIPLGGNRRGLARTILNLFIVWGLTGLWHGASWNFVLWGLYYFVFLVLERLFLQKFFQKLPRIPSAILSHVYLLLVVTLGWVWFKFTDIRLALTMFKGLFGLTGNVFSDFVAVTELKSHMYFLIFCVMASTPLFRRLDEKWRLAGENRPVVAKSYTVVFCGLLPVLYLILSTAGLVGNSYNPFLYFQF